MNKKLNKEIINLENKLSKLKDLYVRDLIRIDDYENDYKNFITQLNTLYSEQEKIKNISTTDNNIDELKSFLKQDFISIYKQLSRTEKRRIWLSIIDYIVIDKDYNIKIFFI